MGISKKDGYWLSTSASETSYRYHHLFASRLSYFGFAVWPLCQVQLPTTPLAAAYGKGYWNPYLSNLSIKIIYSNNFLLYHDLAILVKFCHPRCFQSHHCFWDGFVHDELAIGHIVVTECFIRYWLILIKLWWHFLSVLQKVASYRGQGRRKGDFSAATWFLKPGKVDWQ